MCVCVWGGSKQLKIPAGGGFQRGCAPPIVKIIYNLEGAGGSGQPGNPPGYTIGCNGS